MQTHENPGCMTPAVPFALDSLGGMRGIIGGYRGESVDMAAVVRDCESLAGKDWCVQRLAVQEGQTLLAMHRPSGQPGARRVYISAGIHGDEPAGPLAVRNLLTANALPERLDLWVCPCLNPSGFVQNRRENGEGLDLNRQYLKPGAREIISHVAWLRQQPRFDLCLCLHEDWESRGFYLYELNPDGLRSPAEEIIEDVERMCPVDHAEVIDGWPAAGGIIRPAFQPELRPDWPEAFFLLMHKTRLTYTFEAPSDFPLSTRVHALEVATKSAITLLETER